MVTHFINYNFSISPTTVAKINIKIISWVCHTHVIKIKNHRLLIFFIPEHFLTDRRYKSLKEILVLNFLIYFHNPDYLEFTDQLDFLAKTFDRNDFTWILKGSASFTVNICLVEFMPFLQGTGHMTALNQKRQMIIWHTGKFCARDQNKWHICPVLYLLSCLHD